MIEELKRNNASFKFIDVTTEAGSAEFRQVTGGKSTGVPFVVNTRTKKQTLGFTTYDKLA
jgi:hypothetical protein